MAIKPLKLKRYISEDEAAQLLSLLIGEKVSSEDMAEYALEGIIPAYMQFSPVDKETYPGPVFSLAEDDRYPEYTAHLSYMEEWLAVIPYPLPFDSWITDSNGKKWKVLAGRADLGVDEITSEHYVRVYAPPEICLAADIMNDPKARPKWPAILHSHGETWGDIDGEDRMEHILSPFRVEEIQDRIAVADGCSTLPRGGPIKGDRPINWHLVVAGLVELLLDGRRDTYKTQGLISSEISSRHPNWPNASKTAIDRAMAKANDAVVLEEKRQAFDA